MLDNFFEKILVTRQQLVGAWKKQKKQRNDVWQSFGNILFCYYIQVQLENKSLGLANWRVPLRDRNDSKITI